MTMMACDRGLGGGVDLLPQTVSTQRDKEPANKTVTLELRRCIVHMDWHAPHTDLYSCTSEDCQCASVHCISVALSFSLLSREQLEHCRLIKVFESWIPTVGTLSWPSNCVWRRPDKMSSRRDVLSVVLLWILCTSFLHHFYFLSLTHSPSLSPSLMSTQQIFCEHYSANTGISPSQFALPRSEHFVLHYSTYTCSPPFSLSPSVVHWSACLSVS